MLPHLAMLTVRLIQVHKVQKQSVPTLHNSWRQETYRRRHSHGNSSCKVNDMYTEVGADCELHLVSACRLYVLVHSHGPPVAPISTLALFLADEMVRLK